jgi:hypothetical protein
LPENNTSARNWSLGFDALSVNDDQDEDIQPLREDENFIKSMHYGDIFLCISSSSLPDRSEKAKGTT